MIDKKPVQNETLATINATFKEELLNGSPL